MRTLNLDHLRALHRIAAAGSFSAAAAELDLTQPAVSQQIRQLEHRVGLRLLERLGRRVVPTEAGRELLHHAERIESALAEALAAMAARSEGVVGRVRLGTGATACIYLLPPTLRELRRCFPALEITVHTGNSPDMLRRLEQNAIDVALVTLPTPGRAFAVTPLCDDEIVALFPPGRTPPAAVTASALAGLPMLVYEPGGHTRRVVDEWFHRASIRLDPIMELGNIEAIKQLVGAGLGCGLVPRLAAPIGGLPSGVVARRLEPVLYRRLGIALRRDKVPDRGLREVIGALRRLAPPPA